MVDKRDAKRGASAISEALMLTEGQDVTVAV